MSFTIDFNLEIDAKPETVWDVVTDLDKYGEWNKFVVGCESSLTEGSPIRMKVRLLPFFAMPQTETILENEPGRKLSYGMKIPMGILSSRRGHVIEQDEKGQTIYKSTFELKGLLAPVVKGLLGKRLERGFKDMSYGIQERARKKR